ncbi:hypothetical protein [Parvularcula maris]|uniref:Uncharacterized protein n=1 Tax=Parvularcula maris TaxID=2965077 RepID=A0A9X2RHF4_9PROT|nr:hypothetical protein [Parvularcula maris]MCQ8184814.1 hypothetical protein [Parvularcula maris]
MWRLLSALVILASLVFNVFALTALLDAWEIADTAWRQPFHRLGALYEVPVRLLAETVQGPLSALVGDRIELPCWWIHVFAMYASSAAAIYAGSMGRAEREKRVGEIMRGGASIFFPLAIVTYLGNLIVQGFRNRIVSRFLTQHNKTALFYAAGVLGMYAGGNYINAEILTGPPAPGQEFSVKNEGTCRFGDGDIVDQLIRAVSAE